MGCAGVRQTVRDWWNEEGKEMTQTMTEELAASLVEKAEKATLAYTEEKFAELDKEIAEGDASISEYLLWLLLGTLGLGGAGAGVMRRWCKQHGEKGHVKK